MEWSGNVLKDASPAEIAAKKTRPLGLCSACRQLDLGKSRFVIPVQKAPAGPDPEPTSAARPAPAPGNPRADSARMDDASGTPRLDPGPATSVATGRQKSVYLVLVAPPAPGLGVGAHNRFLGRASLTQEGMQGLMRGWIDTCASRHGGNCSEPHGSGAEFLRLLEGTYFGVIDLCDMQLKPLPVTNGRPAPYVTLSYVWGGRSNGSLEPYTTTSVNVMQRIGRRGLDRAWDDLPRTIRDAFVLTRRLHQRYLWIDSLCIVQDSINSWELNAKAMHLVYGHAYFTICAADGDAATGLTAIAGTLGSGAAGGGHLKTPNNEAISACVRIPVTPAAVGSAQQGETPPPNAAAVMVLSAVPKKEDRFNKDEEQHTSLTAEILPGVQLLVSRSAESVIQDSVWNQRGWTFQERLLSRRCLVFAEGQVYFQCRTAVMSQDILNDGGDANSWSLDWANSPLRTLGELRHKAFWFYMKCVGLYTGRHLTRPKDVLTAFQGTSWLLQKHFNAPLLYGLPTSHFDLALLWVPLGFLERRKQNRRHWPRMEQEDYGGREFPSWSWCGWMGGKAGYQVDVIDGCLLNVREWLRNHTWILWYVRDEEGNLRPLWDRTILREDSSEEARWRGYDGLGGSADGSGPGVDQGWPRGPQGPFSNRPPPNYCQPGMTKSLWSTTPGFAYNGAVYGAPDHRTQGKQPMPRAHGYPAPGSTYAYQTHPQPSFAAAYGFSSATQQVQACFQPPGTPGGHSSYSAAELDGAQTGSLPPAPSTDEWSRRSNQDYLDRLPPGYYDEAHGRGAPKAGQRNASILARQPHHPGNDGDFPGHQQGAHPAWPPGRDGLYGDRARPPIRSQPGPLP
ncbi:hypothetical protein MAPG_10818 [Magnaporthiopsis poae ATCC 64411]|uniref:Heterokaryon incompatibility domain-containing protein n=1 Tax=Magnaporthiopsis poae (strain ATCC 64411 / 73-15) TaxID=644358 RepID=A0A0C4EDL4_MAGP6|nr:hypothetical protein MAPG_10818 [Magnaporthiopsis poae ATCC 64411]